MYPFFRIRFWDRYLGLKIRVQMRESVLWEEITKLKDLAAAADETGGAAFAMYPTSMEELMAIADEGKLMPPKSTWFEPKLRSWPFYP